MTREKKKKSENVAHAITNRLQLWHGPCIIWCGLKLRSWPLSLERDSVCRNLWSHMGVEGYNVEERWVLNPELGQSWLKERSGVPFISGMQCEGYICKATSNLLQDLYGGFRVKCCHQLAQNTRLNYTYFEMKTTVTLLCDRAADCQRFG